MKEQKVGYYAEVQFYFSSSHRLYLKKVFGKKFILNTKEAACELLSLQRNFKKKARKIEIPILSSKLSYLGKNENGSYMYIEQQPFIAKNLKQAFLEAKTKEQLIELLNKYLLLFQKTWLNNFLVSLDPVVDNFGLDESGNLHYFDFFPPYQRIGERFFDWPKAMKNRQKFITNRHFSHKQAQVIYSQLLKTLAKNPLLSLELIKNLLYEHLEENIANFITVDQQKIRNLKRLVSIDDADFIRVVASEKYYKRKLSTEDFEKIFTLTHIYPNKKLDVKKNLAEAVKTLNIKEKL